MTTRIKITNKDGTTVYAEVVTGDKDAHISVDGEEELGLIPKVSFKLPLTQELHDAAQPGRYAWGYRSEAGEAEWELFAGRIQDVDDEVDESGGGRAVLSVPVKDLMNELNEVNVENLEIWEWGDRLPDGVVHVEQGVNIDAAMDGDPNTSANLALHTDDLLDVGSLTPFKAIYLDHTSTEAPGVGPIDLDNDFEFYRGLDNRWPDYPFTDGTNNLSQSGYLDHGDSMFDEWVKNLNHDKVLHWGRHKISGTNMTLREVRITTHVETLTDNLQPLIDLLPTGWTHAGPAQLSDSIMQKFRGESLLGALRLVHDLTGDEFRRGSGRQLVELQKTRSPSGITIKERDNSAEDTDIQIAYITRAKRVRHRPKYTHAKFYGAGQEMARVGMQLADTTGINTTTLPNGDTISVDLNASTITNVTAEAAIGDRIDGGEVELKEIGSLGTSGQSVSASTQLLKWALTQMAYNSDANHISYEFEITALGQPLRVGETVNILYSHYDGDENLIWQLVNVEKTVIKTSWGIDDSDQMRMTITLADNERRSDASLDMAREIYNNSVERRHEQPVPVERVDGIAKGGSTSGDSIIPGTLDHDNLANVLPSQHHAPVTLSAAAQVYLALTGQEIDIPIDLATQAELDAHAADDSHLPSGGTPGQYATRASGGGNEWADAPNNVADPGSLTAQTTNDPGDDVTPHTHAVTATSDGDANPSQLAKFDNQGKLTGRTYKAKYWHGLPVFPASTWPERIPVLAADLIEPDAAVSTDWYDDPDKPDQPLFASGDTVMLARFDENLTIEESTTDTPSIRDVKSNVLESANSITVTAPTMQDNDTVVLTLGIRSDTADVTSWPTGFTENESTAPAVSGGIQIRVASKYVTSAAGEPASYQVDINETDGIALFAASCENVEQTVIVDDDAQYVSGGNVTLVSAPAVVAERDKALLLVGIVIDSGSVTISTPSGMTSHGELDILNTNWMSLELFSEQITGTGSTGTRDSTLSEAKDAHAISLLLMASQTTTQTTGRGWKRTYGTVSNYTNLTGGKQRWTFTPIAGSEGDGSSVIPAGSPALGLGASGAHYIRLISQGDDAPGLEGWTWSTDASDPVNHKKKWALMDGYLHIYGHSGEAPAAPAVDNVAVLWMEDNGVGNREVIARYSDGAGGVVDAPLQGTEV